VEIEPRGMGGKEEESMVGINVLEAIGEEKERARLNQVDKKLEEMRQEYEVGSIIKAHSSYPNSNL